jgi:MFS family permease
MDTADALGREFALRGQQDVAELVHELPRRRDQPRQRLGRVAGGVGAIQDRVGPLHRPDQAGGQLLAHLNARVVAVTGLALAAAGYAVAAGWPQPAQMVTGLSIAALGIGATFVTAFTASLADAGPAEGGLRSALVNTFHELGGAAGVAVLSSAAGAGLVTAHLCSHDFARAFTVGAACAVVAMAIAAAQVPAVRSHPQQR